MQTPYWEVSETDYHTDASVHSLSIPAAIQVNQSAKCCSAKGMRQHSLERLRGSDGISDIFRPPVDSDSALGSFSWLLPKRWSGKLMKIDPPAILHMVWNSNWIQLESATAQLCDPMAAHLLAFRLQISSCDSVPKSSQQARQSERTVRLERKMLRRRLIDLDVSDWTCQGIDQSIWPDQGQHLFFWRLCLIDLFRHLTHTYPRQMRSLKVYNLHICVFLWGPPCGRSWCRAWASFSCKMSGHLTLAGGPLMEAPG